MSAVCGRTLHGETATLPGFGRHPVVDQDYPGIRPNPDAFVTGVLYRNLDDIEIERLDHFEGALYLRSEVAVTLPDGQWLRAETYVFGDAHRHLLCAGEWDFRRFLDQGKARFMRRYVGFQRLPETERR